MILITGCTGYIGSKVAKQFLAQGKKVIGIALPGERGSDVAVYLMEHGMKLYWYDITTAGCEYSIAEPIKQIYHFVGIHSSLEKTKKIYVEGCRNVLELAGSKNCEFVLIASNSAVYGSHSFTCREDEEYNPEHPFGEITCNMESLCKSYYINKRIPVVIMRIGEVYGDITDEIKHMKKHPLHLLGDGENYTSRIHIEDLIHLVMLAQYKLKTGEIYNVSDTLPVLQKEYYTFLVNVLKLMPPIWVHEMESRRMIQSIHGLRALSIKMFPEKLIKETGYEFIYPTYREGVINLKKFLY